MGTMPPDTKALAQYGRELRTLRDEAGLTQTALARRVSISKSTISDIERGKTAPTSQLRADLVPWPGTFAWVSDRCQG